VRALAAILVLATTAGAGPGVRVGAAGVTLALPSGWHSWVPPGGPTSGVTDPLTRVVAVSAPFRFASNGCQVAGYAFPATAVAIVIVEWIRLGRNDRWAARPGRFTRTALPLRPPPAIECFAGPGGSIEFAQRGRDLGAYLLAGRKATPRTIARARSVLDSLRVTPR
jgi:hypothetical protein